MSRCPILCLLVLTSAAPFVTLALAQKPDHPADPPELEAAIVLTPRWEKGDAFRLTVSKTRQRFKGEEKIVDVSGTSVVRVVVLEATEGGFVLEWSNDAPPAGQAVQEPLAPTTPESTAVELAQSLRMEILLDAEASVTGLRNWDEVKAVVDKLADETTQGLRPAERKKFKLVWQQMFGDQQNAEPLILRTPTLLLAAVGHEFESRKPKIFDGTTVPNPFGGDPFPTTFSLKLIAHDDESARVELQQVFEPKRAAEIMQQVMKEVARRTGNPGPADGKLRFEMMDAANYRIDVQTGWPIEMDHRREVRVNGDLRVDTIKIISSVADSKRRVLIGDPMP